ELLLAFCVTATALLELDTLSLHDALPIFFSVRIGSICHYPYSATGSYCQGGYAGFGCAHTQIGETSVASTNHKRCAYGNFPPLCHRLIFYFHYMINGN